MGLNTDKIVTHTSSYEAMRIFLNGDFPNGDEQRKICNNTVVIRRSLSTIALCHYRADLITWNRNGSAVLRVYNSVTSRRRLNLALHNSGWYCYSHRGLRLCYSGGGFANWVEYSVNGDLITIWPDGRTSATPRRPKHRAFCKCPACYRHSKCDAGWRRPWHDAEEVWILLTQQGGTGA